MRTSLFFTSGLIVLAACGLAAAQDTAPLGVKIILQPDGSVRVVDASTGKPVQAPAKPAAKPPQDDKAAIEAALKWLIEQQNQKGDPARRWFDGDPKEIDRILKALQIAQGRRDGTENEKIEIQQKGLKVIIGPDGKAIIITDGDDKKREPGKREPAPAGSVDQKLDMILKQLGELRKDVDVIKKKLDTQKGNTVIWDIKPGTAKEPPKEKKLEPKFKPELPRDKKPAIDPETQKRIDALIKELEQKGFEPPRRVPPPPPPFDPEVQKVIDDILKKLKQKNPTPPAPPTPPGQAKPGPDAAPRVNLPEAGQIEELQRAIDHLRRQIDQLKRESQEKKATK